jgi:hypothetical protein
MTIYLAEPGEARGGRAAAGSAGAPRGGRAAATQAPP